MWSSEVVFTPKLSTTRQNTMSCQTPPETRSVLALVISLCIEAFFDEFVG